MTVALTVFDVLIVAALVWAAARALGSETLLTAVAMFVAFGFLMTLVWVRLRAPDVALAEAGIGAGFTGALLLAAVARLRAEVNREGAAEGGDQDDDATGGDDTAARDSAGGGADGGHDDEAGRSGEGEDDAG